MKVLITGSNGLVGQKLIEYFCRHSDIEIIATSRNSDNTPVNLPHRFYTMDICNSERVQEVLTEQRPDVVINTAAITHVDYCEEHKEECWKTNYEAVIFLVKCCNEINAHFIHFSTDFVFDGLDGPYKESDKANPVSYYGKSKLQAEQFILNNSNHWAIVRTILVYGIVPHMVRSNIVLWVKNSLEQSKHIHVVNDQFRAPTLVDDLAKATIEIAFRKANGIFHLSGKDFLSVYEIALHVAKIFKLDTRLISEISSIELNEKAKRPVSTGFELQKAMVILDYKPCSLVDGLQFVKDSIKNNLNKS